MKLEKLYKKAVEIGIGNDLRGKAEIKTILKEEMTAKTSLILGLFLES